MRTIRAIGWCAGWLLLVAVPRLQATETVTLYVTNAQGTVVAEMTPQGQVTYTAAYRPYGQQVTGIPQAGPGYTGHVNDPDTGLVYMQQRYYDPESQQFQSVDPVGPAPGNVFNFGRYAYANNNPIRYTDPDGKQSAGQPDQERPPGCSSSTDGCPPQPRPKPKPKPTSPNPTPQQPTVLPAVTVTATALPIAAPIGWGEIGGTLVIADPLPTIFVGALLWPTKMGAAPCEMPGGPRCGMMSGSLPPGYWSGDSGAAEWGRRNGVGAKEGKDRFHRGVKEHTPGARGDHDFGVNPETGDVVDQNGEPVGNLNDE